MTPLKRAVKQRDERASSLGYVPRPLTPPSQQGTLSKISGLLEDRAHKALLRRIKSS